MDEMFGKHIKVPESQSNRMKRVHMQARIKQNVAKRQRRKWLRQEKAKAKQFNKH